MSSIPGSLLVLYLPGHGMLITIPTFSPPGGYLNHTTDMSGNSTVQNPTSITSAVPAPTNALNGSTTDCGLWYTVSFAPRDSDKY